MEYHYYWKHTTSWKETSLFNATVEPWCHSHWSLPVAPSSIHPWNARSVVLLPPILNLQQLYITLWIDHDRSIYIYIALPSCSYIYRSKPIYQEVPKKNMASLQKNLLTPVLHAILEALPRQKFHDLAGNLRKNTMNIPHSLPMGKFSTKKNGPKNGSFDNSQLSDRKTWSVGISRLDLPRLQLVFAPTSQSLSRRRWKNTHQIRINKNPWVISLQVQKHWL